MRGKRKGNTKRREINGGKGRKKNGGKRERERKRIYRAARLAGNYMAFVSDGAFNDLSSSKSL